MLSSDECSISFTSDVYKLLIDGYFDKVDDIFDNKTAIDVINRVKNIDGSTLLMYACRNENIKIVKYLISRDDVSTLVVNRYRRTALHYAASSNEPRIAQMLLDKEPGLINMKDDEGNTALHDASYTNNEKNVEILLSCGADVNAKNNKSELADQQLKNDVIFVVSKKVREMIEKYRNSKFRYFIIYCVRFII